MACIDMARNFGLFLSRQGLVVAIGCVLMALPGIARADTCQEVGAIMKKREAQIAALNRNTKAHGGKLDPIAACPQLRALAAIEGEAVANMTKNKDWCSLPDELISRISESRAKSSGFAAKACEVAAKIKKMQAQQAAAPQQQQQQQQALKLPAGPL